MTIFYMDVKIIGRSSGRDATGAATYKTSKKLRLVEMASYMVGRRITKRGCENNP